jgi:hypothetical protein
MRLYLDISEALTERQTNSKEPAPDYYVHPSEVDLVHILAPRPAIASPQGKADLRQY